MKTSIKLQNGFNYSERVYSVNSEYKTTEIHSTGECTWAGSESVNGDVEIEIPSDSIGLVRAGFSQQGTSVELAWGELDMNESLPKSLQPSAGFPWAVEYGQATKEPYRILTIGQYIRAQIEDKISLFNSKEWVEMPYEWGSQDAACYWRLVGNYLESVGGTGDQTPYLKTDGTFSSTAEDREEELIRFDKSCDAAESFQGRSVFNHLKSSFQFQNNPLPSLRKKFGGEWKYFDHTKEDFAIWRDGGEPMMFIGEGWFVTYKPSPKE
jgi:hypothetical protein